MKKIIFAVAATIMMFFWIHPCDVKAAETTSYDASYDDPEYEKATGDISEEYYDGVSDEDTLGNQEEDGIELYNLNAVSSKSNSVQRRGIDVSKYQGNIDWNAAKNAGVEFAIIRVGYRGMSSGSLTEDSCYASNIQGALNAGIRVGVYIFSQAVTEQEAIEEANFVLSRVYSYNIMLPVVIDYEYDGGKTGRLYTAGLSNEQRTSVCEAFCNTVRSAGYTPMVYANKWMLEQQMNAASLSSQARIWLANYGSQTSYEGDYDFWQYSSTGNGTSYGASSQYIDLDYWYDDGTIYGKDYGTVFDAEFYANTYPDIRNAYGTDPAALLQHFINRGMIEGRRGNQNFDVYIIFIICSMDIMKKEMEVQIRHNIR